MTRSLVCLLALLPSIVVPAAAVAQPDQPGLGGPSTAPAPRPAPPPPPPPTAQDREEPRGYQHAAPAAAGLAPDGSPVVRAEGGNLGLFFRFGGLASLFATGNSRTVSGGGSTADALVVTQVGVKVVRSENWMIPIYFGSGVRLVAPDKGDNRTDWGLDAGAGFEYHFRIWRRISPFAGLNVGFGFADPTGEENMLFGFGIGPSLGVEYYIGDRVSLTAQYLLTFQLTYQQVPGIAVPPFGGSTSSSTTAFGFSTMAGGAMSLNYYF